MRAERDVAQLADDRFSPTFLRPTTAYGVSPRLRFDIVLNNLVAWAVTTGRIHLKSDGTPWRPIVHIEDISRAFLAVLEAPRELVHNQVFNVGRTDENFQIRELAEIVAETVPGCRIEFAEGAGPDTRSYRVDFGKIARSAARLPAALDACGRARASSTRPIRAAGSGWRSSRGRATGASTTSGSCSAQGRLDDVPALESHRSGARA